MTSRAAFFSLFIAAKRRMREMTMLSSCVSGATPCCFSQGCCAQGINQGIKFKVQIIPPC